MKHTLGFLVVFGLLVFGIHNTFAAGDTSTRSQSRGSQSAVGTIDKITDDKITVKTEDGKTRSFTIDQAQRDLIKSQALKEGDRIDLALNKQNQVVGVNKSNEFGGSSNRGSSTAPGAGSPDSGMNPNSGSSDGMGNSPNPNTGGTGSNPETGTGGGMNGGPNTGAGGGMGSSGGTR